METRTLGDTGATVSRLGLGLAEIRGSGTENATTVLNRALDGGITLFDTAAGYGDSEELLGEALSHRRHEYFLVTKAGPYGDPNGGDAWTGEGIRRSIDDSLTKLRTDHVDVVLLHTCTIHELERDEILDALTQAKEAGKTRFIGFSGDNDAARWCVDHGGFDVLESSLSVVDQHGRVTGLLRTAKERGIGVIGKRPLGNHVWGVVRHRERLARAAAEASKPEGWWKRWTRRLTGAGKTGMPAENVDVPDPVSPFLRRAVVENPVIKLYYERAQALCALGPIEGEPEDAVHTCLGFTLAHDEIDCAIVGTGNRDHVTENLALMQRGAAVPANVVDEIRRRFDQLGTEWTQIS